MTNWQIDNNLRFQGGWYEKREEEREGGGGLFVLEREKGREKGYVRERVRKIFDNFFFFLVVKCFTKD